MLRSCSQLVCDRSIKMPTTNGCAEGRRGGTSGSLEAGEETQGRRENFTMFLREISGGVDIGRLPRQKIRNITKLRADLGC